MVSETANGEIWRSAKNYELWGTLSWSEIRQRYRRTTIGPFWLTLSLGVTIFAIGILYAGLFASNPSRYIPYLASGTIVWTLLSGVIIEACNVFISAAGLIKSSTLLLPNYLFRLIWKNVIIFGHNILILPVLWLIFGVPNLLVALLAIPGLAIDIVVLLGAALTLSVVCTRFRDAPQIVAAMIQLAFFVTPIVWLPEGLRASRLVITLNPMNYLVAIVREPLLGQAPDLSVWLTALSLALVSVAIGAVFYGRFRHRIAYWL